MKHVGKKFEIGSGLVAANIGSPASNEAFYRVELYIDTGRFLG